MGMIKSTGSDLPVRVMRPSLFRPESIEARRMAWLGRPAVALGLPTALVSVGSVLMAAAAVALVIFGSYVRRIELHGVILPSAGLIQVTSPAAGRVQSIAVRDGQTVAARMPLYIINTDTNAANTTISTQQQVLQALTMQRQILVYQIARKVDLRNQQDAEIKHRIENLQAQVQQTGAEMAMKEEFVRKVTKDFADFTQFQQQHLATLGEKLAQQSNWMRAKDEFERLKSEALHAQGQLVAAQFEPTINALQINSEIDAIRAKIAELDQQIATTEVQRSIEILAPGAGTVTAIAIHPDQTVASGARMLTIVPAKNTMHAELLAPSSGIGFIRPGQRVLLRYSAFPYQRFGQYSGTVSEVSRAALQPEELKSLVPALPPADQSKTFYRVIVTPDRQEVQVSGHPELLQASMQVDATVLLEARPIYQWLIQPLYDLRRASA
jgi:membrane fusion protein